MGLIAGKTNLRIIFAPFGYPATLERTNALLNKVRADANELPLSNKRLIIRFRLSCPASKMSYDKWFLSVIGAPYGMHRQEH